MVCEADKRNEDASSSSMEEEEGQYHHIALRGNQWLKAKYQQLKPLGEGGHRLGSAGYRRSDNIPVAIKHIPKGYVICQDITQNKMMLPLELTVMIEMATAAPGSVGKSAAHPGPGTSLLLH